MHRPGNKLYRFQKGYRFIGSFKVEQPKAPQMMSKPLGREGKRTTSYRGGKQGKGESQALDECRGIWAAGHG